MGKQFERIEPELQRFIEDQKLFFVATAPLEEDGLVNVSPKGLDTFRVLDEHTVAYADLTGSGVETVAHLKQNGRIVIMFCAFEGAPKIVRLHGSGEVIEPANEEFAGLSQLFDAPLGLRSVIRVRCKRYSTSCGFGVPLMEFKSERTQLPASHDRKGQEGLERYWEEKNRTSLDGLPGIESSS